MDYDSTTIPASYDRARDHTPEVLDLWMDTVAASARQCSIRFILDLGCGTGRFSQALETRFAANVIGIDPSAKMLGQALAKPHSPRVLYAMGCGEKIPLRSHSVDLIFISMVFHHFASPVDVVHECSRVLCKGGLLFLRAGTLEQILSYPYVPFFPGSVPIMKRTLVEKQTVQNIFAAAGMRAVRTGILVQQVASTYAGYADRIAAGGDSVLARLDPREFEAGLKQLREHAARVDPKAVTEPIDFFVFVNSLNKTTAKSKQRR
jgi:ubiquinone/menaquinone biosynthesis C-methylase UbiE